MSNAATWDALFNQHPNGSDLVGQMDNYILATRQAVKERIAQEHLFDLGVNAQQGLHKMGSARVWFSPTEPDSPIPDAVTEEDPGDESWGRIWVVTEVDDSNNELYHPTGVIKVHNGTSWEEVSAANGLFIQGKLPTASYTEGATDPSTEKAYWKETVKSGTYHAGSGTLNGQPSSYGMVWVTKDVAGTDPDTITDVSILWIDALDGNIYTKMVYSTGVTKWQRVFTTPKKVTAGTNLIYREYYDSSANPNGMFGIRDLGSWGPMKAFNVGTETDWSDMENPRTLSKQILAEGTVRVKFNLAASTPGTTVYARIMKKSYDGTYSWAGTERSSSSTGATEYSEDITVAYGDTLILWGKGYVSETTVVRAICSLFSVGIAEVQRVLAGLGTYGVG